MRGSGRVFEILQQQKERDKVIRRVIKIITPNWLKNLRHKVRSLFFWRRRGYLAPAPQFIKQNVFLKYHARSATWVETGTYLGTTTRFLKQLGGHVYSIEPSTDLYFAAKRRFDSSNVTIINDVSERALGTLLPKIRGDINFWLDGHYSAGITFKGASDCPVLQELEHIAHNMDNFENVVIFVDDVRCFYADKDPAYASYPNLNELVDWCKSHNFKWTIEQDIFVMTRIR